MTQETFKKLMEEFPELWAIKNSWYVSRTVITISHANEGFDTTLSMAAKHKDEIWIRTSNMDNSNETMKLFKPGKGYKFAPPIKEDLKEHVEKFHIAIKRIYIIRSDGSSIEISIYKPPKREDDFNFWLA